MNLPLPRWSRLPQRLLLSTVALALTTALLAQKSAPASLPATPASASSETLAPDAPVTYDADAMALILARRYVAGEGNADSRIALLDALGRMGWDVRNHPGLITHPAPAGTATGLAMRDYEIDELLWKPADQPTVRFISFAQAVAIPFEDADPEELAQDLLDTLRKSADSDNPQQRFWARFIIALGRVSPSGYDLTGLAPAPVIQPSQKQLKALEKQAKGNPFALIAAMQPQPVWDEKDPVLAASPRPERDEDDPRSTIQQRDQKRLDELSDELNALSEKIGAATDPAAQKILQDKLNKLMTEMAAISNRSATASTLQAAATMRKLTQPHSSKSNSNDESEEDDDSDSDDEDDDKKSSGPRFIAEWRDQPLSLLQVSLLTRVLSADLRLYAKRTSAPASKSRARLGSFFSPRSPSLSSTSGISGSLPFAMITLAQLAPAPAPNFGDQFSGAGGDIWATVTGAYTGAVLDHHLPDSKFSKAAGIANVIIAWYKTIMSVARQKITIEVENAPLVRTKNRTAGEKRTAKATVEIDFPKSDVLKAIRAAGNLTTIDLQLPDGGPVSGAKVVWRLVEGSYNNKYQTAKGGWEYKPELAVVQFAEGAGYTSTTNDAGEATITIEGAPQKKILPKNVRPYMRRAAIAVEVTIKVGNITQDMNDAINTAMGGPVGGGLSFLADMVLRTSFFFQKSQVFDVKDWKEPHWEGDFEITAKASGSKSNKGEKGGPPVTYKWKMERSMEGRLITPDWDEDDSQKKDPTLARYTLEVDGDSRYFKLDDSSSAKSSRIDNRYEATGPVQIQPSGQNQLAYYGRSEPSGNASLSFTGGKMILEIEPFFGAECVVGTYEKNGSRSSNRAETRFLSLLDGVYPSEFRVIEDNDGTQDYYEGTKTFDGLGNLPFVPQFDLEVVLKWRVWRNNPPPKNKTR
ncbi:hypothetical protein CMV30_17090 [Nibricoccus aquaticus]|uniref:Uncharacterized protein n=1 Tax=Nibricoccus aquaticus TaxID=2576891 RepID=A0A290QA08_9BACT|nr:hypothetical protein [Nibricoccus aquaticus]ATC65525.1 hypothetical protein CMV30_17090 [Nibricoccus aquaticus]